MEIQALDPGGSSFAVIILCLRDKDKLHLTSPCFVALYLLTNFMYVPLSITFSVAVSKEIEK